MIQINFRDFKKQFLYLLVGSLVISACIGIISVLFGKFDELMGKVLLTLFMVIVHSLLCLFFAWTNKEDRLPFFNNVLFGLVVLSFITSILGIWEILRGTLVWDLYLTYFVLGISAFHGNILATALRKEKYLDKIVFANIVVVCIVAGMLIPTIYSRDALVMLGEFYFRVLAAVGIIDGTLSVLTMIFYKIHKHSETELNVQKTQAKQPQPGIAKKAQ